MSICLTDSIALGPHLVVWTKHRMQGVLLELTPLHNRANCPDRCRVNQENAEVEGCTDFVFS